jgi:hypothetical protein
MDRSEVKKTSFFAVVRIPALPPPPANTSIIATFLLSLCSLFAAGVLLPLLASWERGCLS